MGLPQVLEPGLLAEEEDEVQRVPASTGATKPTSWEPGPCLASQLPPWAAVSLLRAQGYCKPSAFCTTATQEVWGMPCSSPRFWLAAALPLFALALQSEPCMLAQGGSGLQTT